MHHILGLLQVFQQNQSEQFVLGVLEEGELFQRASAAGIQTVHFSNATRVSIPLLYKMIAYIKREKISVVHTHGPRANVYANILRKLIPFQWVVTIHSHPLHDFIHKGRYGNILSKLNIHAVKHADRVIAISEPFRTSLTNAGVQDGRIITALNGIDFHKQIDRPYEKSDFGFAEDDFIILMVARLEHVKGHHTALEAFSAFLSKKHKCHILLVGDGSLKKALMDYATMLGITNQVHFMGNRNDADRFYHMADVTMLTSFSESFPLVLLESARANTPVISTDVGGVRELILDRSIGWKVQPGNIMELTAAMEDALRLYKKGMLSAIGKNLKTHASDKFTVEKFAENVYNIYISMDK
ncbi:glycosyltransferase family 4 protein [Virgibacillus sp. NKC19-3]|uniref:glycosyltransferase family 4 protein n=1 Tax=Virgibacillus saliphilus TaxID=2831674 RepID=UPI001C9A91DE|nr:glycosyltransferase family 4 protein [Virgibacillus sp. NKC19-3]MBY7144641.1 glycosyltransferase family 4 protein [Virgibacillus sp. NKC19-3]